KADQVGVIIFALFKRWQRRAIDLHERPAQAFSSGTVGDALDSRHPGIAAITNGKEAPFDASQIDSLMTRQTFDAVAEQLEPELALDAVRSGNRSEGDAALAAVRRGQA